MGLTPPLPGRTLVRHPRDACRRCSLFVQTPQTPRTCRLLAAAAAASAVSWSLPIRSHPCTALARSRARGVATRWTTRATTSIMLGRAAFKAANLPCRGLRTLACTLLLAKNALVVPRYALSIARRTSCCARFLASLVLSYRARPPTHQLPASRRFHQPCACVYRPKGEINGHRAGL